MALTDVVLALYLEGLPRRDDPDGTSYFEAEPLTEAAAGAFALGCALGAAFPDRVRLILEQTHPGEVDAIISDCADPLEAEVAEAREAGRELEPSLFMASIFEAMDDVEPVEADVACNVVSIGFEYGCILAEVERRAAQMVRNSFNRRQAEVLRAAADADSAEGLILVGPDPERPVQELAQEVLAAYEKDFGFGQTPK